MGKILKSHGAHFAPFFIVLVLFATSCSDYMSFMIKANKMTSTPFADAPFHSHPKNWPDKGVYFCWLGHATVLLKIDGTFILTDPVLLNRIGPPEMMGNMLGIRRIMKLPLELKDLPPIDLVLISHAHYDHLCIPSLRSIMKDKHRTAIIVPDRTADLLKSEFPAGTAELKWGENLRVKNISVRAFRVEHYSQVPWGKRNTPRGFNGYMISGGGKTIAFFGDTSFDRRRDRNGIATGTVSPVNWKAQTGSDGEIDLGIIPVGDYLYANHSSPRQALSIAERTGCAKILPIHYGTFILSPAAAYKETSKAAVIRLLRNRNKPDTAAFRTPEGSYGFPDAGKDCAL